jgi:hypothetical protein
MASTLDRTPGPLATGRYRDVLAKSEWPRHAPTVFTSKPGWRYVVAAVALNVEPEVIRIKEIKEMCGQRFAVRREICGHANLVTDGT